MLHLSSVNWLLFNRRTALSLIVLAALLFSASPNACWAQEPAPAAPGAEEPAAEPPSADAPNAQTPAEEPSDSPAPPSDEPEPEEPGDDAPADGQPTDESQPTDEQPAESDEPAPTADDGKPGVLVNNSVKAVPGGNAADAASAGSFDWLTAGLIVLALIAPIVIGNWLATRLKMPDHAWKISLVFTSIVLGVLCVTLGTFKGGIDLSGGVILIYEVADKDLIVEENADTNEPTDPGARSNVKLSEIIEALKMRVDPGGIKEISIRPYGQSIEVIIPKASGDDLNYIKKRLTDPGELEFRIVANPSWPADRPLIEQALALPTRQQELSIDGQVRAKWVEFDDREFSENDSRLVIRQAGSKQEALVKVDAMNVTGKYLSSTQSDFDEQGSPAVSFTFTPRGAARFEKLTGNNLPSGNNRRFLGIILDKRLISAPNIRTKISSQGQISGGAMSQDEVDYIVSILQAGSLPAALNPTPISEYQISASLGEETIRKATIAIVASLATVLLFILFFYRFAGVVACLALGVNLLLVLALMVLFKAAFTLPGMAGLVLTVGMSVDANVLIFERIREELSRGSSLRMAIRNGFDRATTTIVDANITTLITGVVLYLIGTDQIKGFAVTLTLGILMSMFTAIFCSRLVFEIAERKRWIKSLNFSSIIGKTEWDFIGKRYVATAFSLLLIGVGLVAVFGRQSGLLDIDFTGGSSITMVMSEGESPTQPEIVEALSQGDASLADSNLSVAELQKDTTSEAADSRSRFTISTSLEDVEHVKEVLKETFGDRLQRYTVDIGDVKPFTEDNFEGSEVLLSFNKGAGFGPEDGLAHDSLESRIEGVLRDLGHPGLKPLVDNPDYKEGSNQRFKDWTLRLQLDQENAAKVAERIQSDLSGDPVFPLANKIGGRVASGMQTRAIQAIFVSLLGIVGYIWFRFQNVAFGLAAVVALVHDVLITLGAVAVSYYLVGMLPGFFQLEPFQISLTLVAAFLTIIGYSLNDTIVIFDRIREVRGKSPDLTPEMVNTSINQTLARTLLTSLTTLIVVAILYAFGGPGIHSFAFALVVGVIAGTYSTVFIACPALLAMVGKTPPPKQQSTDSPAEAA